MNKNSFIITSEEPDELVQILKKLSEEYYDGNPSTSDEDYDSLLDKLKEIDPKNPFLKEVGAKVSSTSCWPKKSHKSQMLSLGKANTKEEFLQWAKNKGTSFFLTEKADGSSLTFLYKDSVLVDVVTRGDSRVGEGILANGKRLTGVPLKLKGDFTGEVRGEALMDIATFEKVFKPLGTSNPRNGATGKLRDQSASDEHLRVINVKFFDIIPELDLRLKTEKDKFRLMESLGFPVIFNRECSLDEVWDIYDTYVDSTRANLPYEIDGLVLKILDLETQKELGISGNHPKGALALKFPNPGKESTLTGVRKQRGHTGKITPVASLEAVEVAGVVITSASLHNWGQIEKLGLHIGDRVLVTRNNDVIPQIAKRLGDGKIKIAIVPPTECMICETKLIEDGAYLCCVNKECGGNITGTLEKWISECNILSLGPAYIQALVNFGITDVYKLYTATEHDLSMALSSVKLGLKAYNSIQQSKNIKLDLFLSSLGIPSLGTTNGQRVAKHFKSLDKVLLATVEEVGSLPGIKTNASKIVKGLAEKSGLIVKLASVLNIQNAEDLKAEGKLSGMSFVITGELSQPRPVFVDRIKANGGEVKSGVSNKVTYLLTNEIDSTTTKAKKATELGIKLITENDLNTLLGN